MNHFDLDYIIVGQGLAGSCLAIQLMKRNRRFIVIDKPGQNRCTVVAAGMFNPVAGQKLVKSWLADILFPYLHEFYPAAERDLSAQFFYPTPLYRPFASVLEQNEWMSRTIDPAYQEIVDRVYIGPSLPGVHDPFGGVMLKQSGYIDSAAFMHAVRSRLGRDGSFMAEAFDGAQLQLVGGGVRYGEFSAAKIIFCEGVQALSNPWFGKLPLRPLKGEIIHIKSPYQEHVILNRGVYMVPGGKPGHWRVGSTYKRDRMTGNTAEGREELIGKLKELANFEFELIGEDWGIRPTTVDRRPVLGNHPEYSQLVILNGLGTKGVSLAPYFSEVLLQWLETQNPLNKEVDVSRFKSLY